MRRPHALSLRASLSLFVITLSAGPVAGQAEEDKGPDRLLRILPVGEAPPFVQKIEGGVRKEQEAPEGSIPPREVVQLTQDGEQEGEPLRLTLDRVSASMPARAGTLPLYASGSGGLDPKPWHKLTVPAKSTHSLALLWRDPKEKKWSKARSMILVDDINSFPAGSIRFVNVSPWTAIVRLHGKSYSIGAYKTARLRGGLLKQVPLRVGVRDKNGKLEMVYNAAVNQAAGERTNVIVYRADGKAPRRPAKVRVFRERARLPPPPRPREG